MKTVWIFGDSFSTLYDDNSIETWSVPYCKWKGYIPKTFGNIISENYNIELRSLSKGGLDNDSIFELIYNSAPLIKEDDIIIIGWSSKERYRLAGEDDKWVSIIPNYNTNMSTLTNVSVKTLDEVLYNRTLPLHVNEFIDRRNFINWLFRNNKLIQWTPFRHQYSFLLGFSGTGTIGEETKNEVNDGHYSEKGHMELSNKFMDLINDDELRNKFNSMEYIKNKLI